MQKIDREGDYRGQIVDYGLEESQGGALGVTLNIRLDQMFYDNQWNEWPAGTMGCYGTSWIIKKDGETNKSAVDALVLHAGWDGDLNSIINKTWQPTPCQFNVKGKEYKGDVSYRAEWVSGYDDSPGAAGMRTVDASKATALVSKYGSKLRAVVSSIKRNAAPPTTPKPPSPPPAPKREVIPAHAELEAPVNADDDEIHF